MMAEDPKYITYLLNPDNKYDTYFLVRNPAGTLEKIGAVRKMLMAYSTVLRNELEESEIAEKDVVTLTDVYPDTFKNFLRYVYGYDTTDRLSFDDADNLLYVAEKYMIDCLKDKLATRLMSMLSCENICSLMNNPACYRHLELNSAITDILQYETGKVLDTPLFLELNPEGFLKILEQDSLNVLEIELWRAAVKWAKYRAGSENGEVLRGQLTPHLQHIRLCTLSCEELCKEVAPTNILTGSEFVLVSTSIGLQQPKDQLTGICNTLTHRSQVKSNVIEVTFPLKTECNGVMDTKITISTKQYGIELVSFMFFSNVLGTLQCKCTVVIVCQSQNSEPPLTVRFSESVQHKVPFQIPIVHNNGKNVCLLPNTTYTVTVKSSCKQIFYHDKLSSQYSNEHFSVHFQNPSVDLYESHVKAITYKVIPKHKLPC